MLDPDEMNADPQPGCKTARVYCTDSPLPVFLMYCGESLCGQSKYSLRNTKEKGVVGSVADPVPNPDPHVFGPPGSGSISLSLVRKTLISIVL
jgi:hypothetical protein